MRIIASWMLVLSCLVSPTYSLELISYWKFDDGNGDIARDECGNNDGIIRNAKWCNGKRNGALEFDGENALVEIQDKKKQISPLQTFTVSAWIEPHAYPKGDPVWSAGIFSKPYYTESSFGLRLSYNKKLEQCIYAYTDTSDKIESFRTFSQTDIALGKWHYVVATYENNKMYIYIDGRLDSVHRTKSLLRPAITAQNLLIGSVYENGRYFRGKIDEVKLYNGVLSLEEIETEFSMMHVTPENMGTSSASAIRFRSSPCIDGDLTDTCWQNAKRFQLVNASNGAECKARTEVMFGYGDTALYVAFICHEPMMDKLVVNEKERDGKIYKDDCVELFVDPTFSRKQYYHFAMNAAGVKSDNKWLAPLRQDGIWDCDWEGKVKKAHDAWFAEIAIPFASMELEINSGAIWGLNFCRERKPQPENSCLSPTGGGFHLPQKFMALKGIDADFSDYTVHVSCAKLYHTMRGNSIELGFSEDLENVGRIAQSRILQISTSSGSTLLEQTIILEAGEKKHISAPVPINDNANGYTIKSVLKQPKNGMTTFVSTRTLKADPLADVYLDRSYYTSELFGKLNGNLNFSVEDLSDITASLTITVSDDVILQTEKNVKQRNFALEFPLEKLNCGTFKAVFSLQHKQKSVFSSCIPLTKRVGSSYEVKADCESLLPIVNGTPFYALGLMSIPETKLAEYGKAGFNITCGAADNPNFIDTAYFAGMKVVLPTYQHSAPRRHFSSKPLDELEQEIRTGPLIRRIKASRNHPAFFGYFWDEPGPAESAGCGVEYMVTKEYDAYHPVWACFWQPSGPAIAESYYDISGHDPYWKPLKGDTIFDHIQSVENHRAVVQTTRKPLWITPQAEGWGGGNNITQSQQRCQVFLDIIHGAKGLMHWTYNVASPAMRETLKELAREINSLIPILVAPSRSEFLAEAKKTGLHGMVKAYKNKLYLICANADCDKKKSIKFKLTDMSAKNIFVSALFESRVISINNGEWTETFNPYATHVYCIDGISDLAKAGITVELIDVCIIDAELPSAIKPDISKSGNMSFELVDSLGQPVCWQSSTNWEYPEQCRLDQECFSEGSKSMRISLGEPTQYSEAQGYGWTSKGIRGFDLGMNNDLLRDGNECSEGIFKVALPDGSYTIIAAMRKPEMLYEHANGVRHKITAAEREIDEIYKLFPHYEKRIREYYFTITIMDGSLDFEIINSSIFSLEVVSQKSSESVFKFDFGTNKSALSKNYMPIAAPQFKNISIWGESEAYKVNANNKCSLRVSMKSDNPGASVMLQMLDYAWACHPRPSCVTVEVNTQWKEYTLITQTPKDLTRVRPYIIVGQGCTVWVDNVHFDENQQ